MRMGGQASATRTPDLKGARGEEDTCSPRRAGRRSGWWLLKMVMSWQVHRQVNLERETVRDSDNLGRLGADALGNQPAQQLRAGCGDRSLTAGEQDEPSGRDARDRAVRPTSTRCTGRQRPRARCPGCQRRRYRRRQPGFAWAAPLAEAGGAQALHAASISTSHGAVRASAASRSGLTIELG